MIFEELLISHLLHFRLVRSNRSKIPCTKNKTDNIIYLQNIFLVHQLRLKTHKPVLHGDPFRKKYTKSSQGCVFFILLMVGTHVEIIWIYKIAIQTSFVIFLWEYLFLKEF